MYGKQVMKDRYNTMSDTFCGKHTRSHENAHTGAAVQPGIAVDRCARDRWFFEGFLRRARGN